jgi:hypothetical protein
LELYLNLNHHLDIKLSSHTNSEISTSPDLQQTTPFNEEASKTLITKGTTHAEFDDQLSFEALVSNSFTRGTAPLFEPSSTPMDYVENRMAQGQHLHPKPRNAS